MAGEFIRRKAMRVLIVEDNAAMADAVREMLELRRIAVDVAYDGDTGLDHILRGSYDVALVDVMVPGRNGFSLASETRRLGVRTPILMLTARDAVEDRVSGLDSGADDYLVKPFAEDELVARVQALARRADRPITSAVRVGHLQIDLGARIARYADSALDLGSTEFRLLEFMARNAGHVFSRAQLLEHVWDYDFEGSSNIVDVYVSQLRKKLRRAGARSEIIETVWGVGYKFVQNGTG
jgi:DNA-binding response OmpR family regulator